MIINPTPRSLHGLIPWDDFWYPVSQLSEEHLRTIGDEIIGKQSEYFSAFAAGKRKQLQSARELVRVALTIGELSAFALYPSKDKAFKIELFVWDFGDSIQHNVYRSIDEGELAIDPTGFEENYIHQACDGIETRFGTSVANLQDQGDEVRVQLSDGSKDVFDLVVGADGLHSHIRALTFGPQEQFENHIGFYVAAFILPGYYPRDELAYVSHTQPGRQISRVALRDDQTLFLFVFSKRFVTQQPVGEAAEKVLLCEIYGNMGWEAGAILSRMDEVRDVYFDRVSQIKMPVWTKGRVALVGDAAACVSLLAGEGTGLAMTEAYVLAGELHRADGDHAAAFRAYQERLQPYLARKQDAALKFAGLFAPKDWFWLVVRDALMNLTSVPILGKRLLAASFRSDLNLPIYDTVQKQR